MTNYDTLAEKATEKVAKRAQYEAFDYTVPGTGTVRVTNASYGDDAADHTYDVTIQNGEAASCTCPADEYQEGPCKHRVAVSQTPAVLVAATPEVATDGGSTTTTAPDTEDVLEDDVDEEEDVGSREECWCADADLPCFDHFQKGGEEGEN